MKKLYSLLFCTLCIFQFQVGKAQLNAPYDGVLPLIEKDDVWPFEFATGQASDLVIFQDTLYAVGTFGEFNGLQLNGILKWDGTHVHSMNSTFEVDPEGWIFQGGFTCINVFQNHLVIGFHSTSEPSRVYEYVNNEWTTLGNELGDHIIYDLIEYNGKLYASGPQETSLLVLNEENNWVSANFPAVGKMTDLEVFNGELFCVHSTNSYSLWKYDGNEFIELLSDFEISNPRSITIVNNELFALGEFDDGNSTFHLVNISESVPVMTASPELNELVGYFSIDGLPYYLVKEHISSSNIILFDNSFKSRGKCLYQPINGTENHPKCLAYKGEGYLCGALRAQELPSFYVRSVLVIRPNIATTISNESQYFTKIGAHGIVNNTMANAGNYPQNLVYDPNLMNSSPIWMSGMLVSGKSQGERLANVDYHPGSHCNWFPGPVTDNYNLETFHKYNRAWKVTQEEIELHISNWNSSGYEIPTSIIEWPGNGDAANGESHMLAPFHDENQNSWYEPQLGDYPLIRGKEAAFWVQHGKETLSMGSPLHLDMHYMSYVVEDEELNDLCLFFHTTVINRSNETYDSLRVGLFDDYDLGFPGDDYIGCDSLLSVAYAYNGDEYDELGQGIGFYGAQVPAFSTVFLSEGMEACTYYNVGNNPLNGDPHNTNDFFNYMQGKYKNGNYALQAPYLPTGPMMFQDSPCGMGTENEIAVGNTPGDRRLISAGELHTLLPNESLCFDFAYYFKPASGDNIETLCAMLEDIPAIHTFYENQNYGCSYINSIDENEEPNNWNVFPNPTSDIVTLQIEGMNHHTKVEIKVLDMQGREVMHLTPTSDGGNVILDLSNLGVGSTSSPLEQKKKFTTSW
ncbi:MAG: T9SS type A sorting domain-containing protein [Flavobacteriales bacterium]